MSRDSLLGPLGLVGAASLCCIGLGALTGGAAVVGGGAAVTTLSTDASVRGALVSGVVTAVAVLGIALVARWRLR